MNLATLCKNIADAIRAKKGTSALIDPQDFPTEIASIPSGGSDKLTQVCNKTVTSITASDLTGATSIPESFFLLCTRLASVTLPTTVSVIGNRAFYLCSSLTTVLGLNNVSTFGEYCFAGAPFTSITLPENATYMRNVLASYDNINTTLTELTVPAGSNISSNYACFEDLQGVTSITIGGNLANNRIGTYCFNHNINCLLYDFTACTVVQTLNASFNMTFEEINANCKIVVPDSLYNDWVADSNWSGGAQYIISESDYNAL